MKFERVTYLLQTADWQDDDDERRFGTDFNGGINDKLGPTLPQFRRHENAYTCQGPICQRR